MTIPTTPLPDPADGPDLDAGVLTSLREHADRSEKHLHELEEDMSGMLADSGTIQEDRDGTRRLIESVRSDLERTQRAIARIEAGTFGQCVKCGNQIAPARLEAIPEAEYCTGCA